MWLWEPRASCPFSQKPIQLCTIVTKHWHTLTRPLHKLYTLIWGPIDCLALEVIFAERLEFAKCWHWLHNMERLCLSFFASWPCLCLCSLLDAQEAIDFLPPLEIQEIGSLGKKLGECDDEVHGDSKRQIVTWYLKRRYSVHPARMISQKSLNFGLKGFRLVHSPAPTPSWWWLVINVIFGFHPGRAVFLETNQSVS